MTCRFLDGVANNYSQYLLVFNSSYVRHGPNTALHPAHIHTPEHSQNCCRERTVIILLLQVRKLRHRESNNMPKLCRWMWWLTPPLLAPKDPGGRASTEVGTGAYSNPLWDTSLYGCHDSLKNCHLSPLRAAHGDRQKARSSGRAEIGRACRAGVAMCIGTEAAAKSNAGHGTESTSWHPHSRL